MSWETIVGHPSITERFQRCAARNRLASTYLFLGPDGIGKRTFALKLSQAILCEQNETETLDPCGSCSGCLQVLKQTHPDLILVSKPADKNVLPIDLFIGRSTHRKREGLVYEIGMKPFRGGYRIAIIDDADYFNAESSNCLLKTLEEPPPQSILILLGTSQQRQLHTIVSRSQLIRFSPLSSSDLSIVLNRLAADGLETLADADLDHLASIAHGSVSRALQLADPDTLEFRTTLIQHLGSADPHINNFAKTVVGFAEAAGKEGYRRRPRLGLVGELACEFFRATYLHVVGAAEVFQSDPLLADGVRQLSAKLAATPEDAAARLTRCIERTGDMQFHVTTNAQFLNVVESWLVDLGRLLRAESVNTGQILRGFV